MTGWDGFLRWARFFYGTPEFDFEFNERESKFRAVAPLKEARFMLDSGDWLPVVRQGFTNQYANLVSHWQFVPFLDWAGGAPESAARALRALWEESDRTVARRLDAFDALLPSSALSGQGTRCNLAVYLLSAVDPITWPNYKFAATTRACRLTRSPLPAESLRLGGRYQHALQLYDRIVEESHARGIPLKDRLDGQGLLWCIAGTTKRTTRPPNFSEQEWREFQRYRTTLPGVPQPRPHPICPLCGHDDNVRFLDALDDGWLFECIAGQHHPVPSEPYEFRAT